MGALGDIRLEEPIELDLAALSDGLISECIEKAIGEHDANAAVLRELLRDWLADARDKSARLRERPNWPLLVSLASAFVGDVHASTCIVQALVNRLAATFVIERSIQQARQKLTGALAGPASSTACSRPPPSGSPSKSREEAGQNQEKLDMQVTSGQPARSYRPRRGSRDDGDATASAKKKPFDAYDPSLKVPSAVEDGLRRSAVRYAHDYMQAMRRSAK